MTLTSISLATCLWRSDGSWRCRRHTAGTAEHLKKTCCCQINYAAGQEKFLRFFLHRLLQHVWGSRRQWAEPRNLSAPRWVRKRSPSHWNQSEFHVAKDISRSSTHFNITLGSALQLQRGNNISAVKRSSGGSSYNEWKCSDCWALTPHV